MNPKALIHRWPHEWEKHEGHGDVRCKHCALPAVPDVSGKYARMWQMLSNQECPKRLRKALHEGDEPVVLVTIRVNDVSTLHNQRIKFIKHLRTHIPAILGSGLRKTKAMVDGLRDHPDTATLMVYVKEATTDEFIAELADFGLYGHYTASVVPASMAATGEGAREGYGDWDKAKRLRDALVKQPELLAQVRLLLDAED